MACFLVPAAEAIVVTAVAKGLERREQKNAAAQADHPVHSEAVFSQKSALPWSRKLSWLAWLLWGGVVLLCFEHIWHGEVVPWFPFLTAASDPTATAEMLHEMATVGSTMALVVTVVWGAMAAVADLLVKRDSASVSDSTR